MTVWTSNDKLLAELSTSDITGRNSHLIYTTKVDRQIQFIVIADIYHSQVINACKDFFIS